MIKPQRSRNRQSLLLAVLGFAFEGAALLNLFYSMMSLLKINDIKQKQREIYTFIQVLNYATR